MAELKPCPFCGCNKIEVHRDVEAAITRYRGVCWDCVAQIYRGTKEEVIEAWNRRYTPTSEIDFDYEAED